MIPLHIHFNSHGQQTYAIPFSDQIDARVLLPNTAETVTIPNGARFVFFAATDDFWVRADAAAAIPTNDVTDGSAPELNPVVRFVQGKSTLSLIAAYNTTVTLTWFS